ncbi:MAG: Fe-S cluster assembly protein SufD, partial [Planctomycetota bacterium]
MSTALQSKTDQWRRDFERLETAIREPAFTGELRRKAFDRFADLGFPTVRDEEWKYTNVAPIAKTPFKLAGGDGAALSREQLRHMTLGGTACPRLVFLNGHYSPQLSDVEALPAGVVLMSLPAALDEQTPAIEAQLGRYAGFEDQPFTALNTAFIQDG